MGEKFCNCNFDSQIAYIIDNKDDDIDIQKNISIINYINDKKLQKKIKSEKKILVCENNNELIKYKSDIKKSHFKHKNYQYNEMTLWHKNWQNIFDFNTQEIIIGNRRADVCIDNNVIEFQYSKIKKELVDMRNINYIAHNKKIFWVIECENEKEIKIECENEKEIKIEFINNFWKYKSFKNCKEIFLDNKNNIYKIVPKEVKNNFILINIKKTKDEFINSLKYNIDIWNDYQNFDLGKIYINQRGAGCGKTYESIQLKNDVRFENKEYFIYLTKMNSAVSIIHNEFTEQYNKYEFTEQIGEDKIYKRIFDVVLKEEHEINNKKKYIGELNKIKVVRDGKKEIIEGKKILIDFKDIPKECNKFKEIIKDNKKTYIRDIDIFDLENNYKFKHKNIIISTIDSFMYTLQNKNKLSERKLDDIDNNEEIHKDIGSNFFENMINNIIFQKGYSDNIDNSTGKIIKGQFQKMKLNNKCLIIIDEAQDLDSKYIDAFEEFINKTGIDLYIIGDKLQSILTKENVFTHYLKKNAHNKNIIYDSGINQVKRFHNIKLKDLVNNHIEFNKYELQPIEKICDKNECDFIHENEIPYKIFEIPEIYMNDYDNNKINNVVKIIIDGMEQQINKKENGYIPKNFMFIFPIIKKNYMARILEERLQQFWIDKFHNKAYIEKISKETKNTKEYIEYKEYMENTLRNLRNSKYNKFVHLHFSVDGKPINLKESDDMTRMVSIHASKGDGREVVFLLGLSEYILSIYNGDKYCKEKDNLIYESLLHVSLTRQKKFIYIGLIKDNGDIWNRFQDCDIQNFTDEKKNNLKNIKKKHKITKIIDYVLNNDSIFNKFNNIILNHKTKLDELWNNKKNSNDTIIDWGHHIIRNSVFKFNIMSNLLKYKDINHIDYKTKEFVIDYNPHQFIKKLDNMSSKEIRCCNWENYNKSLQNITNKDKEKKKEDIYIPILEFSNISKNSKYNKYINFLENNIKNIQEKIIKNFKNEKIPILCPFESVIYYYCRDILDNGIFYDEPTIMNIYDIIYHIDNFNCEINHNDYKCLCHKLIDKTNKDFVIKSIDNSISKSYTSHYDQLLNIKKLIEEYRKYIDNNNIEQKNLESKGISKNAEEIKYNEDKYMDIKIGKNEDNIEYIISNEYELFGYNYKYIINCILVPQFSKLTYNNIFIRMIFEQYLIKNNTYKNKNKQIIHCIFSLDNNEPYFYSETELCNEEINSLIEKTIEQYIIEKNNKYYEYIFEYYHAELRSSGLYKKSFENLYSELKDIEFKKINDKKLKQNKIPEHILKFMDDIEISIEKIKKNIKNKDEFDNKFKTEKSTNILLNKENFKDFVYNRFIEVISKDINDEIY